LQVVHSAQQLHFAKAQQRKYQWGRSTSIAAKGFFEDFYGSD
jgi:hypothetical protein